MDAPEITALVVAALGSGGLGVAGSKLYDKYAGNRRKDSAQDHDQYMEMFKAQGERIAVVEAAEARCQEENAKLNREIGAMREAVNRLEGFNQLAVITADETGKICGWNHGATAIFGYVQDEVGGKDVDILIPVRLRQQHHDAFRKAVTEKRGPVSVIQLRDSYGVHRNGAEFPVTIHLRGWEADGKRFYAAEITKRT